MAREIRGRGAPICITHPGAILGAPDPGPGEQRHTLAGFLGNRYPFLIWGAAMRFVDVHWCARAHVAMFRSGVEPPPHLLLSGHVVPWNELFSILRRLTGRSLPQLFPSIELTTAVISRGADVLQRVLPLRLPLSYQKAMVPHFTRPMDNAVAEGLVGPQPPIEESLAEAIRWLGAEGHLPRGWLGRLNEQVKLTSEGVAPQ